MTGIHRPMRMSYDVNAPPTVLGTSEGLTVVSVSLEDLTWGGEVEDEASVA
jgi:hypothetical protein